MYEWRYPPTDQRVAGKRYDLASALQNLFTRLQSARGAVDPEELVKAAGVNVAVQQDAQEFSILFLDWIDQVIAEKPGEEKLQSLFTGKIRSTIK